MDGKRRATTPQRWGAPIAGTVAVLLAISGGVWWQQTLEPVAPEPDRSAEVRWPTPTSESFAPGPSLPPIDVGAAERVVRTEVAAGALGPHVRVIVADPETGQVLVRSGEGDVIPASTLKLLTGAAALSALGPDHRFATTVRFERRSRTLTLVGGGDPLLTARDPVRPIDPAFPTPPPSGDLRELADQTVAALRARDVRRISLAVDTTLFADSVAPSWPASYVTEGVVTPLSALWLDAGRIPGSVQRVADPAAEAERTFRALLEQRGITVDAAPAPRQGAVVASVESATVAQLVRHLLEVSDNETAEVLAHHVALAEGQPATFAGAGRAVTDVLGRAGLPVSGAVVVDGSGLSRTNRLAPDVLAELLTLATTRGEWAPLWEGLAVAGATGSLTLRFDAPQAADARGWVRAKTGTLTGVSALVGVVTRADGTSVVVVLMADAVTDTEQARRALDRLTAALAAL